MPALFTVKCTSAIFYKEITLICSPQITSSKSCLGGRRLPLHIWSWVPEILSPPCINPLQDLIFLTRYLSKKQYFAKYSVFARFIVVHRLQWEGQHVGGRLWQTHPSHSFGMFLAMKLHEGALTLSTADNLACRRNRYSLCGGKDCNSILRLPPRRYP